MIIKLPTIDLSRFQPPCKAHTYGTVDDKGYQYCERCGEARHVPVDSGVCKHQWVEKNSWNTKRGKNVIKVEILYECKNCGEPKVIAMD